MEHTVSIMHISGEQADVDIDLSAIDLTTPEGKDALAAAFLAALAELPSEDDLPDSPF